MPGRKGYVAAGAGREAVVPAVVTTSRRAWLVWGIGVLAYAVAVFQRASLGVAGPAAQHRFGASASALSLFAVLQLGVYASLQVPVGAVLDRVGSRAMIAGGAVLMAAGQLTLALATSLPLAISARVLVGAGDAMTFVSVLRIVTAWFGPRQIPLVTQLTGILGQLGQVAAAYPLVALLGSAGWTPSFLGAAGSGLLAAVLVLLAVTNAPPGTAAQPVKRAAEMRADLRQAWAEPGTRLGLWTHFTSQFSGVSFALLWGYPFLVNGERVSPATAGALLTILVLSGVVVAPTLGQLAAGWPMRRSVLVFVIVGSSALVWTVVLAWPGRAPLALLVLLVVVLSSNGPGSMLGFDYARSFNSAGRLGSASGIVNVGGFVASLTLILLVGVVLDALTPAGRTPGLNAFRVAFCLQYALWGIGMANILRSRRSVRARLADDGVLIDPLHAAVARRWRDRASS